MDANKMKLELYSRLDVISSNSTPGLLDSEASSILTEAEFQFVENLLPFVDSNELVKRQLSTLYTPKILTRGSNLSGDQSSVHTSGEYWDIDDDIFQILSEEVKITSPVTCLNNSFIPVKPITHDEYSANIKNPFRKPAKEVIWKLESSGEKIELIKFSGVTEIVSYHYTYIKRPQGIVPYTAPGSGGDGSTNALINSILPDITHEKIVNIAVTKALKYLGLFPELQADLQMDEQLK